MQNCCFAHKTCYVLDVPVVAAVAVAVAVAVVVS